MPNAKVLESKKATVDALAEKLQNATAAETDVYGVLLHGNPSFALCVQCTFFIKDCQE